MSDSECVDIFRYRDYRLFLLDNYELRKSSEYGFSYRRFARKVSSAAPNYLKPPSGRGTCSWPSVADEELPLAGFSVIEAENVEEVIRLVSNTPCARARGIIEIRSFRDSSTSDGRDDSRQPG